VVAHGFGFYSYTKSNCRNTWSIRILRGNEGLAGKNLQIAAVAGRRDVGSSGSKFACPRESMKDFSGD